MLYIKKFMEIMPVINRAHCSYLERQFSELREHELVQLDNIIKYFVDCGNDMQLIADSYNLLIKDSMVNKVYFLKNDRYMYQSFDEVNKKIYSNPDYMNKYMIGLALSHYLWLNHITLTRYFNEKLIDFANRFDETQNPNSKYVEAGPGYGECFLFALQNTRFNRYEGIDISETAAAGCDRYIKSQLKIQKNLTIKCMDFYDYDDSEKADAFVCSEVLEHIENPDKFIRKVYDTVNSGSFIYITTAINAPSSGHIYLFRNEKEVFDIVEKAGFSVEDYIVTVNSNNKSAPARDKEPLLIALILKK